MSTTRRAELIQTFAKLKFEDHGLFDWKFGFDKATSRAGCCHHRRKLITVTKCFVTNTSIDMKEIQNTILHEIAHAIVGKSHNHDAIWRQKAIKIGCDGKRCHTMNLTGQTSKSATKSKSATTKSKSTTTKSKKVTKSKSTTTKSKKVTKSKSTESINNELCKDCKKRKKISACELCIHCESYRFYLSIRI